MNLFIFSDDVDGADEVGRLRLWPVTVGTIEVELVRSVKGLQRRAVAVRVPGRGGADLRDVLLECAPAVGETVVTEAGEPLGAVIWLEHCFRARLGDDGHCVAPLGGSPRASTS